MVLEGGAKRGGGVWKGGDGGAGQEVRDPGAKTKKEERRILW